MTRRHGVSSTTPDNFALDQGVAYRNYGELTEVCLGATRGGGEWALNATYRKMPVDGERGDIKGFKRLETCRPTITINPTEMTATNIGYFIPGANNPTTAFQVFVDDEAVGTGDDSEVDFELDQTPSPTTALTMYSDAIEDELTTDYTLSGTTVSYVTAPTTDVAITADYTYAGTVSDYTTINLGDIEDADYWTNVTLLVEIAGKSNPLMIKLLNTLPEGDFTVPLAPMDESVPSVTFVGHYSSSDLDTVPFQFLYPDA